MRHSRQCQPGERPGAQALVCLAVCCGIALTGCGRGLQRCGGPSRQPEGGTATYSRAQPPGAQIAEQQEILQAQQNHERKVEVTVSGRVAKMLPEDTRGLPHERFLLQLDNGTRVLVAHDTRLAPRVPLNGGEFVRIHGEYIWNERGGVIHWTHHTPNGRHEPGWIDFDGKRYE